MSYSSPLPSNPSLVALLFFIRTRTGPRFVCHYPPEPERTWQQSLAHVRYPLSTDDEDTTSAGSSSSSDYDEHASDIAPSSRMRSARSVRSVEHRRTKKGSGLGESDEGEEASSASEEGKEGTGPAPASVGLRKAEEARSDGAPMSNSVEEKQEGSPPPETNELLGYDLESLARLLCPTSRKWHKEKFELALDDLVYVGCPMYAKGASGWAKGTRRRKKGKNGSTMQEDDISDSQENSNVEKSVESVGLRPASERKPTDTSDQVKDGSADMTMFNIIFVMRPRYTEHTHRIKDMFDNVIKILARAMKYQQRAEGYVWEEARKIITIRDKLKATGATPMDIWPSIASGSSLASALAAIFDSISTSKIAMIHLGSSLDVSLQIPQPTSTRLAPTPNCKQIPGLPLTSFNAFDESASNGLYGISPYSAILLLRSPGTLLKEIESDTSKELSASLGYFIRNCRSTKSLQKLSRICRMPLADIQFLSSHLIHWRRARAIPPLQTKQTYIVSPNADFSRLAASSANFSRRFAALPSLEAMLGKIGRSPKEWGTFIPSSDHKAAYMEILAWLIREGWVTPLRTFAWIRVTAEVKLAVREKILEEEREAAAAEEIEIGDDDDTKTEDDIKSTLTVRRISGESRDSRIGSTRLPRFASNLYPHRPASDAGSVNSARTAVPISATETFTQKPKTGLLVEKSPQRPSSRQSSTVPNSIDHRVNGEPGYKADGSNLKPSTIISPHKANALESRWIEHMGNSLDDVEVSKAWPSLIKYFDGKYALEEIATREGLKRVLVSGWLSTLIGKNYLVVVRHW